MRQIDKILQTLGEPYDIQNFDGEDCIHRKFGNYEFEVSGTHCKFCVLYVWTISPKVVVAIYIKAFQPKVLRMFWVIMRPYTKAFRAESRSNAKI